MTIVRTFVTAWAASGVLVLASCAGKVSGRAADAPPPTPVAGVDLTRYQGLWYEIARYPTSFQRNCQGVTAQYALRPDGRITVINTCRTATRSGRPRKVKGVASPIEGSNGARVAVNFAPVLLPKGQGNYWVLHLDPDYRTALVGSPSGSALWMLSRTPTITPDQRAQMEAAATRNGFRLDLLEPTIQPETQAGPTR
jgi:apolipoprotein D and lipocalin family protein